MLHEKRTKEEMIAGANLAKSMSLVQIRPKLVNFDNRMPRVGEGYLGDAKVVLEHHEKIFEIRKGFADILVSASVIMISGDFKTGQKKEKITDYHGKIYVEYLLTYSTPEQPMPQSIKDFSLPAFAKTTALTMAWPYVRHHIDHLASLSDIPFIMPILCLDVENE